MCLQHTVTGTVTVCMRNSCELCTRELATAADYRSEQEGVIVPVPPGPGGG